VPHKTTVADLKGLGFDPVATPNVKILTYLDLINRFIPNNSIRMQDLQPDVRSCIESKDCCHAYELTLDVSNSKRYGNVCLDVFGFTKNTHITGWSFKALIIVKDDVVAYKIRSAEPNVGRPAFIVTSLKNLDLRWASEAPVGGGKMASLIVRRLGVRRLDAIQL
jgi:hypothetical protein